MGLVALASEYLPPHECSTVWYYHSAWNDAHCSLIGCPAAPEQMAYLPALVALLVCGIDGTLQPSGFPYRWLHND